VVLPRLPTFATGFSLEALARELLPRKGYDYYASAANDEITLRENRAAYDRITLLLRMLVDVSARRTQETEIYARQEATFCLFGIRRGRKRPAATRLLACQT
jgi:hypothetical protein